MKMDFRAIMFIAAIFALSACGQQRTASSTFEKTSEECLGLAIPQSFVVKYFDGHTEVVSAESKDKFINGFLTKNLDKIEYAEHDFRAKISASDVHAMDGISSWADNWGEANVSAGEIWQQNIRGEGVTVAIIDTGMDLSHPQLRNQIAVNTGETGLDSKGHDKATNGIDDDGNGYIDDAYGFDFVTNSGLTGDHQGHGTHIAGVIAGEHSDSQVKQAAYVQGLAPKAKLLPLAFLDEKGQGSMIDAVRAVTYAVSRGAKVINASWGGSGCSRSLKEEIASLSEQGVVFVTAAGNESSNIDRVMSYPASLALPAQITVGAIGDHNTMANYSNYGAGTVNIFAPGTAVVSTFPGGRLASMTGTSMATPFVAGAVALLLSAEPTAKVETIRQAIYNSAIKDQSYINSSRGRLNLTSSVTELRKLMH
jgi:subtilisin family serine protease